VVRVGGLVSLEGIKQIRQAIDRYIIEIVPTLDPSEFVMEADEKTARNLWRMNKHDPFFENISRRPSIRKLISTLVHGEPVFGMPRRSTSQL
jgi:hypothetical protein